jgi:Tfp pilus assembly protein PilV
MRTINTMRRGFMLPDVMIAVFVTATALVAIMTAILPAFRLEIYKRDEIIATGLAQEGIELVRNVRDNNWKNGVSAFAGSFPNGATCVDYKGVSAGCSGGDNLYRDAVGLYSRTVNGSSKFHRTVTVATGSDTATVTSVVTWPSGTSTGTVTLTDTLTAWGNK